jgi:hypothetical protein
MEPLPLKDIHLPGAISWWPPAPGWWLLPILLATLIVAGRLIYKRITLKTARKTAQKLLKALRQQPTDDPLQTLIALSALLRRTAISIDGRNGVAELRGEAWLEYLDRALPDAPFTQGIGRCLADGHYRQSLPTDVDIESLLALCERWLKASGKKS